MTPPPKILVGLFLLGATSSPQAFRAGLWTQIATPGLATIDGRRKEALPMDQPSPEKMCMVPAAATAPAVWMTGQLGDNCSITHENLLGGRVDIKATCANPDTGESPGTLRMTGRWSDSAFDVHFATQTRGNGQSFAFSGQIVGRRLGDCGHDQNRR